MGTSLEARLTKKVPFVLRDVDPTTADYHFDPPHLWLNRETDTIFLLTDVTSEVATWIEVAVLGADDNYVTDAEKAALHAAGGDTTLGAQTENLNMNTHQIEALSVPDATGEAIRQTAKITETGLESDYDKLALVEALADVTDAVNIASSIHGAAAKATPVDADEIGGIDTENSNVLKKHTWTQVKAFLKAYFDTLYVAQ